MISKHHLRKEISDDICTALYTEMMNILASHSNKNCIFHNDQFGCLVSVIKQIQLNDDFRDQLNPYCSSEASGARCFLNSG